LRFSADSRHRSREVAAADKRVFQAGKPLFVQISDTHAGFNTEANPDVHVDFTQTVDS